MLFVLVVVGYFLQCEGGFILLGSLAFSFGL